MSVASMSGYLANGNNTNITITELPLEAPVATNSGGLGWTAVNAYVVPAGTWLVSAHLNCETILNQSTTFVNTTLIKVFNNATQLTESFGGNPAYFKTQALVVACPPFVSDGTDTLTITISCFTSAGQWQSYVAGVDARAYITKISN